nr:substrate-binding domain-containing protein [Streptomyces sp. ME18-1-4]
MAVDEDLQVDADAFGGLEEHLMPIGLTTVRQDAVLLAEHAVRFAVERLKNPELAPREAMLEPKLVVRASSGPPPERAA